MLLIDKGRFNFHWNYTGRVLNCNDAEFDTLQLFHQKDSAYSRDLQGFFDENEIDWSGMCNIYYTRFLTEAVLSALCCDEHMYNACLNDPELLTEMVKLAHAFRNDIAVTPIDTNIWGDVEESVDSEEKVVDPSYRGGESLTSMLDGDATVNFYQRGVSAQYKDCVLYMPFVVPKSVGLFYMTEAILCARLLLRKVGAVPFAGANRRLGKLSEVLRYCYTKEELCT